jgi:siderophore synthetase component
LTEQLTETEFRNTFGNKMTDVTQTAEPVVDIWNYVEELVKQKLVDNYVYENNLVETVYRNETSTFDHILLPTKDRNIFITLVVDLTNKTIFGYIKLDLNQKYGVTK